MQHDLIRVQILRYPAVGRRPMMISVVQLRDAAGSEIPSPIERQWRFTSFNAVEEELRRHFGSASTFKQVG